MFKWDFIKLDEVCTFQKGKTGLAKAVEGKYTLVATGKNRKSCNTFQFDTKAVCIPLVSSTGHGHASLKYVHYQEGKFALGTILVAVIPKDEKIINAQFLHLYLSRLKDTVLVPLMTGAANVTLTVTKLKQVKVPLPPIEEQLKIVSLFNRMDKEQLALIDEITHQQILVKKLRQSILQEAIEGKLTASWRKENQNIESASVLLEKIKDEKEELIKEKKIKKQKPLPPIDKDEIPFDIPDGWEKVYLQDISLNIHYGFNASAKPEKLDVRMLRITDIQNNSVNWNTVPGCDYTQKDLKSYSLSNNDILIARTGGTIGKSYIVKNISVVSLFASYLIRVIPNSKLNADFLKLFIESPFYWTQLYEAAWGAGQPNVNGTSLSKLILALPPLKEQKQIVKKIESLFKICDELETQINTSKANAQRLMQSVLKEAFENK